MGDFGMTWTDLAALAVFLVCWLGYEPLLGGIARRSGSLNTDMLAVRQAWMRVMTRRETRLIDGQLMGHSINSASFFASANLLLIAAVAGVLFGGEAALRGVAEIGVAEGGGDAPIRLLEVKLGLVMVCLARGLLDFIWSLRQMNYTLALIGASSDDPEWPRRDVYAKAVAEVLNPALNDFSRGVRGYYFALAAGAWLFGPLWLAGGAAAALGLLLWRQARSPAADGIRRARAILGDD